MHSSNHVGRSLAAEPSSNRHHHQAYDLSYSPPVMNDKIHNYSPELEISSPSRATSSSQLQDLQDPDALHFESHSTDFEHEQSPKIKLDLEVFENHLLAETSNLRDDFSCTSYSSNSSSVLEPTKFPSCI